MATEALKSTPITNLDASPVTANTEGEGASGRLRAITDTVTATAGVTTGSTYRLCRIPTTAKVKRVLLSCAAEGATGAADINVAHSDSTTDGTPASLQGTIPQIAAADNKLFGAAVVLTSALKNSDTTFANTFTPAHQNLPLWQVLVNLGVTTFAADPGGFFDILLKTTATMANGGFVAVEVDYVE